MRVLLVEDSERLQRSLSTGLRKEGYAVDAVRDGLEGLWYATHHPYDVIVLDLMLPQLDGLSMLRKLRDSQTDGADVHVLVLTAKDAIEDRVAGLRAGADDYLVKPFAFDELLARIEALMRRRHHAKNPLITIGDVQIDTTSRRVLRDGKAIDLSAREFALLHFMALRAGEVVSRAQIEEHLYDEQAELMSNVIDAAIYSLRKKIDAAGRESLIQTRRGMGYVLAAASAAGSAAAATQEEPCAR